MVVHAVGGVVHHEGRLLMVLRAREPEAGRWSVPGGKVEPGESHEEACVRELLEETGLAVTVTRYAGSVHRPTGDGGTFAVRDFVCSPAPGSDPAAVRAADDARAVGWFTSEEVRALETVSGLVEALDAWGLLP